jgi:hypothetical protein
MIRVELLMGTARFGEGRRKEGGGGGRGEKEEGGGGRGESVTREKVKH